MRLIIPENDKDIIENIFDTLYEYGVKSEGEVIPACIQINNKQLTSLYSHTDSAKYVRMWGYNKIEFDGITVFITPDKKE